MSIPGKSLKGLCKKLGVRLTVKRGKKRVYKSVKVLKAQCKRKQKKKKKRKVKRKRRRKFGSIFVGDTRMLSSEDKEKLFYDMTKEEQISFTELSDKFKKLITERDPPNCEKLDDIIRRMEIINPNLVPDEFYKYNNHYCSQMFVRGFEDDLEGF